MTHSVREEELLYILRHLATLKLQAGVLQSDNAILRAAQQSSRAHLFRFYPLLLEVAFLRGYVPSMWLFPDEHAKVFGIPTANGTSDTEEDVMDAGDGGDLVEVSAKDLARRCLEVISGEMGLS